MQIHHAPGQHRGGAIRLFAETLLDAAQRQEQLGTLSTASSTTRLSSVQAELTRVEQALSIAVDARLVAEQRVTQLEQQLKLGEHRFEVERNEWQRGRVGAMRHGD